MFYSPPPALLSCLNLNQSKTTAQFPPTPTSLWATWKRLLSDHSPRPPDWHHPTGKSHPDKQQPSPLTHETVQGSSPGLTRSLSNNTSLSQGLAAGEKTVKSTPFTQFNWWLSPFWFLFFFLWEGLLGNMMKPGWASRDKRRDVVSASRAGITIDSTTQWPRPLAPTPPPPPPPPLSHRHSCATAGDLQSPISHLEANPQWKVTLVQSARQGRPDPQLCMIWAALVFSEQQEDCSGKKEKCLWYIAGC